MHTTHFNKGRGALSNPGSRFDAFTREALAPEQQDWPGNDAADEADAHRPKTVVVQRMAPSIISRSQVPVGIVTKNALVTRDMDVIRTMAAKGLVHVSISLTTLDHALARKLDPRASSPTSRLQAMLTLAQAGIPVAVFASPMIPAINDVELEKILQAAAQAGARCAPRMCCTACRRCVGQW